MGEYNLTSISLVLRVRFLDLAFVGLLIKVACISWAGLVSHMRKHKDTMLSTTGTLVCVKCGIFFRGLSVLKSIYMLTASWMFLNENITTGIGLALSLIDSQQHIYRRTHIYIPVRWGFGIHWQPLRKVFRPLSLEECPYMMQNYLMVRLL